MKYRRNKVKREHGIIQNALPWLENLARLSEVIDIIPGVIDVSHSSERGIVYKYKTQTGCKLLLKSNGSIQEVFVVTKNSAHVEEWIKKEFPSYSPAASEIVAQADQQTISKKKLTNIPIKLKPRSGSKPSTSEMRHSKKHPCRKVPKFISGERDDPNIADRLDPSTLKALNNLKQFLVNAKIENTKIKTKRLPQK